MVISDSETLFLDSNLHWRYWNFFFGWSYWNIGHCQVRGRVFASASVVRRLLPTLRNNNISLLFCEIWSSEIPEKHKFPFWKDKHLGNENQKSVSTIFGFNQDFVRINFWQGLELVCAPLTHYCSIYSIQSIGKVSKLPTYSKENWQQGKQKKGCRGTIIQTENLLQWANKPHCLISSHKHQRWVLDCRTWKTSLSRHFVFYVAIYLPKSNKHTLISVSRCFCKKNKKKIEINQDSKLKPSWTNLACHKTNPKTISAA